MPDATNLLRLIIQHNDTDPEDAEIFVDGTIGGQAYRFLLDTGAARTTIAFDTYSSTFDVVGSHSSSGVFAKTSADLITVPDIQVGSLTRTNFTLERTRTDDPYPRNLIGMDLLKDSRLHFHFDENYVSVDAPQAPDVEYIWHDLFLDKTFHPYVDVLFGNTTAKTVWDTGASITVVDMAFIQKHPAFFQQLGQSEGTDVSGTTMESPMFMMSPTVIGGLVFPSHKVAGVDLSFVNSTIEVPMNLILGYSTLSKAHWIFDFPRKKWAISKQLSGKSI